MEKGIVVLLMTLMLYSCKSSTSTVDCTPEREKHMNKMQKIPMPSDTVKKESRPKYN